MVQQRSEMVQQRSEMVQQRSEISHIEQLLTGPKSSPTPSTLGRTAVQVLEASQNWIRLQGTGDAVLQHQVAAGLAAFRTERSLVQAFTPHLQRLVQRASDALGIPLVLVNTETHAYFKDPHGGAASAPDMLVTHPAFYRWKCGNDDANFSGPGYLFGEGASWCLRDCWEVIIEWKTSMGSDHCGALGEAIEYARRKSYVFKNEENVAADVQGRQFTRLMLCDHKGFHLVLCHGGQAVRCVFGEWIDPGSVQALVDFFSRGFQTESLNRAWVDAIKLLCGQLNLVVIDPCQQEPSCFLGSGGCGRVFRVCEGFQGGEQCALKVGLGDVACSQIREEWSKYEEFSSDFGDAREAVISVSKHFEASDRTFAAILVKPVGQPLPATKKCISSALEGLMKLSRAGFGHGDARRDNVVWTRDECCKWLDLRTIYRAEDIEESFVQDAATFLQSFDVNPPLEFDVTARSSFSGENLEDLLKMFSSIWKRKK
uniref:Uncharacterized protein n=1 Tax=Hemiselmis andersenii TaxID=464988 RepID=A0A7S1H541_HEMAN|mmetsp:Transcript_35348/g.86046  ORF Transcript_35348/g.86046 Transcript_35348/m.86046 type:complete len:485 (+) Transcript_35348:1-1455(+)